MKCEGMRLQTSAFTLTFFKYPAAVLAPVARDAGARLAIVNPERTALDRFADWLFRAQSEELLPRLL